MTEKELREHAAGAAEALDVPGVAVGVEHAGDQHYAFHGVTSIEHPLAIGDETLFAIGSMTKTFTAAAVMRLVEQGRVELDERVRTYIPELRLKDERVAEEVTVLNLLNHTAGWQGDVEVDTGEGDDALARFVEVLASAPQQSPLGGEPSYNNAALVVAGHLIEKVTGTTYERALKNLLLAPLGLEHTHLSLNDIMSRRFAAGHTQLGDGSMRVYRPYSPPRCDTPSGGRVVSTAADQIAWARFHLGNGRAADGTRVLSEATLAQMQTKTSGGERGERYGIGWIVSDLEGVRIVKHGGSTAGHHSMLTLVPERDFAVTVLTNASPNGQQLHGELVDWALESYLDVVVRQPEPLELDEAQLAAYAGTYQAGPLRIYVAVEGSRLRLTPELQPEAFAQARAAGEDDPLAPPPFLVGLLDDDRFVIVEGSLKGNEAYFVREGDRVTALNIGRLASRVGEPAVAS